MCDLIVISKHSLDNVPWWLTCLAYFSDKPSSRIIFDFVTDSALMFVIRVMNERTSRVDFEAPFSVKFCKRSYNASSGSLRFSRAMENHVEGIERNTLMSIKMRRNNAFSDVLSWRMWCLKGKRLQLDYHINCYVDDSVSEVSVQGLGYSHR